MGVVGRVETEGGYVPYLPRGPLFPLGPLQPPGHSPFCLPHHDSAPNPSITHSLNPPVPSPDHPMGSGDVYEGEVERPLGVLTLVELPHPPSTLMGHDPTPNPFPQETRFRRILSVRVCYNRLWCRPQEQRRSQADLEDPSGRGGPGGRSPIHYSVEDPGVE